MKDIDGLSCSETSQTILVTLFPSRDMPKLEFLQKCTDFFSGSSSVIK
jgi:hypothetical protein